MAELKAEYKNKQTDISYREVLTSPWLGAVDFDDDKDTVVILEYAFTATAKFDKGREDTCVFARFKGYDKEIVVNATNAKQIHKFTGTANVGEWKNVPLQIYIDANVRGMGGEIVSGWRIRPKQPKISLPTLTETNPQFKAVAKRLANNEATLETVRKHFAISEAVGTQLMALAMELAPVKEGEDA